MKQVYRSKTAFVLGWAWLVFALVMAIDLVARYSGAPSLVAGAVLGGITAIIYITALRPATILEPDGVRVRNPLRNAYLPWPVVNDVRVSHAIIIEHDDGRVRCWTPQSSARERAQSLRRATGSQSGRRGRYPTTEPTPSRGQKAADEAFAGRTHADWVAEQITQRAESAGDSAGSGPVRMTWSIDAIAVAAAAVALVIAAVIVS